MTRSVWNSDRNAPWTGGVKTGSRTRSNSGGVPPVVPPEVGPILGVIEYGVCAVSGNTANSDERASRTNDFIKDLVTCPGRATSPAGRAG
jgi:hypothetical protein